MTTPEEYALVATNAYKVDPMWARTPPRKSEKFPPDNPKFVVISDPVSDSASGFQGMAVAPLVGGVADYSRVYVAFAGTNPGHRADLNTDVQVVVGVADKVEHGVSLIASNLGYTTR